MSPGEPSPAVDGSRGLLNACQCVHSHLHWLEVWSICLDKDIHIIIWSPSNIYLVPVEMARCLAYTGIFICHFRWAHVPQMSSALSPSLVHSLDFLEHLKRQWMLMCEWIKRAPSPRSSCLEPSRIFALQQDANSLVSFLWWLPLRVSSSTGHLCFRKLNWPFHLFYV